MASFFPACVGTLPRRAFVRAGLTGISTLGLADLLRLGAAEGVNPAPGKSVILLWLWGGPSHLDTFDLKPESPVEFRGEFRPIPTSVPGLEICELLPRLARLGRHFSILRSLHHDSPGHVNSTHTMLTGHPGELEETPPYRPRYPDFHSVVQKELGPRFPGLPAQVALPSLRYGGSAYLGVGLEPFPIAQDPNAANFGVPSLAFDLSRARLGERLSLLEHFDSMARSADATGTVAGLDRYQAEALSILTSGAARTALDLSREHPKVRDRYGRHIVGQRCLLARRLVEAGVRIVTVDFPHVPGQKAFSWDDHASVWNIFEQMKIRLPVLDQVVSALIGDLEERGRLKDVLVLVMGEMSHTPRINYFNGQPGREHWGRSMSVLLAGGGLRMGQAVGSTNRTGEEPLARPCTPGDLLATLYQALGVPLDRHYVDHLGRPISLLPAGGRPIAELVG